MLAAAALLLSGPGMRLGLWSYRVGLAFLPAATVAGLAAAALAIAALCIPAVRKANFPWLLTALAIGAGSAAVPLEFLRQARSVPPINDISTDLANPAFAEQQRKAYPDIQPLERTPAAESMSDASRTRRSTKKCRNPGRVRHSCIPLRASCARP